MPGNRATISSAVITASAQVTSSAAVIHAVTLQTGTTQSVVSLRNGGATGTIQWEISNVGTTAAKDTTVTVTFPKPLGPFTSGIYATMAGTSAQAWVSYELI